MEHWSNMDSCPVLVMLCGAGRAMTNDKQKAHLSLAEEPAEVIAKLALLYVDA